MSTPDPNAGLQDEAVDAPTPPAPAELQPVDSAGNPIPTPDATAPVAVDPTLAAAPADATAPEATVADPPAAPDLGAPATSPAADAAPPTSTTSTPDPLASGVFPLGDETSAPPIDASAPVATEVGAIVDPGTPPVVAPDPEIHGVEAQTAEGVPLAPGEPLVPGDQIVVPTAVVADDTPRPPAEAEAPTIEQTATIGNAGEGQTGDAQPTDPATPTSTDQRVAPADQNKGVGTVDPDGVQLVVTALAEAYAQQGVHQDVLTQAVANAYANLQGQRSTALSAGLPDPFPLFVF